VVNEVGTADEARTTVRALTAKRPDAIKFWVDDRHGRSTKLTPEIYTAIIEQAHELGFLAIAHIYTLDDAKGVLRAGVDGLAHMVRDQAVDDELIELLQRDGVFAFTSLGIERTFYDDSDWLDEPALIETVSATARAAIRGRIAAYPPDQAAARKAHYAVLQQSLRTYADNGVHFVLSGDTGAVMQLFGIAEHRELESIAHAGVPSLQAIHAATQRPADILGLPDRGSLEPGKRADLLVLEADPLDDIANTRRISAVYFAGQAVDRAALRARWT
jgi:imidazolonepropionase-like amidohydrolase